MTKNVHKVLKEARLEVEEGLYEMRADLRHLMNRMLEEKNLAMYRQTKEIDQKFKKLLNNDNMSEGFQEY